MFRMFLFLKYLFVRLSNCFYLHIRSCMYVVFGYTHVSFAVAVFSILIFPFSACWSQSPFSFLMVGLRRLHWLLLVLLLLTLLLSSIYLSLSYRFSGSSGCVVAVLDRAVPSRCS